jgi:phage terminase small subunit
MSASHAARRCAEESTEEPVDQALPEPAALNGPHVTEEHLSLVGGAARLNNSRAAAWHAPNSTAEPFVPQPIPEASMAAPKPRPAELRLLNGRTEDIDGGGRKVKPGPAFKRLPPKPPEWLQGDALAEMEPGGPRAVPPGRRQGGRRRHPGRLLHHVGPGRELPATDRPGRPAGENSQGIVRAPYVAILEAATKELRALAAEFGLTPSSDGRLRAPDQASEEANPLARPELELRLTPPPG